MEFADIKKRSTAWCIDRNSPNDMVYIRILYLVYPNSVSCLWLFVKEFSTELASRPEVIQSLCIFNFFTRWYSVFYSLNQLTPSWYIVSIFYSLYSLLHRSRGSTRFSNSKDFWTKRLKEVVSGSKKFLSHRMIL